MEDIYQWALQVLFFEDKQDKKKLLLNKEGYCLCQACQIWLCSGLEIKWSMPECHPKKKQSV